MPSAGQILSQAREARGRSLEQVSLSTRISIRNLQALESDDLSAMHSAFFYKSFARQFAQDLGLDYGVLEPAVQAAVEAIPAPKIPGQDAPPPPRVAALRVGRPRKSRLLFAVSSFAVALIGCSAIYSGWQSSRFGFLQSWATELTQHSSHSGKATAQSDRTPAAPVQSQASTPQPSQPQERPPTAQLDHDGDSLGDGYKIVVSASEPAWLSIVTDGRQIFKGILERRETKVLEGHENARLRTGNAGAVNVVFNGRDLGALGPRGQIRTVLFTKSNYEVLNPPAHVALAHFTENVVLKRPLQQPDALSLF